MFDITSRSISPESVVDKVRSPASGCVVTYVGLIRDNSHGKAVRSVEYRDVKGNAAGALQRIADEAKAKWPVEAIAITHRVGLLNVGDINLVVAVAAEHRGEGFAAATYIIDRFKERLPTSKTETYQDGTVLTQD
jgi:molybdopterin synthase catalytic subunit